jgi:Bacteriophage Sf6, terminase small subunit-like
MPSNSSHALKQRAGAQRNGSTLGRPKGSGLIYGPDVAEQVLKLISEGKTLHAVAALPGMPTVGLICSWSVGFSTPPISDFAERYAYARRSQCEVWACEVIEIADQSAGLDMAGVAAAQLRTRARQWVLSKLRPEVYGDRLQVSGNTGSGAVVNVYLPAKGAPGDGARVTIDGQAVDVEE